MGTPVMGNLVVRADGFAAIWHRGQTRKYTGEPYINHTRAVMKIVTDAGGSDVMAAAALLHDTIEDCGVSHEQLVGLFGYEVADLVLELTDHFTAPEHGNRATRKAMECARLAQVSGEAQTIKLADLIDNSSTIAKHDAAFAKIYMAEKQALLTVLTKGNQSLRNQAKAIVSAFMQRQGS